MLTLIADNLVVVRKGLTLCTVLTAGANVIASASLLAYQTILTSGYNEAVPALFVASFMSVVLPIYFLYMKPFTLGGIPNSKRARAATFMRSIAAELLVYGALGAFLLIATVDLHTSTPGLLSSCGGYAICRLLTCCLALSCLNLLSLAITWTAIFFSFIYHSFKRRSAISSFTHSFADVDWGRYGSVSRHKRRQQLKREAENAYKMEDTNGTAQQSQRQSRHSTVIDDSRDSVFVVMDDETDSVRTSPRKRAHSRGNSMVIGGAL